jgi:glutamate N-acetyltransferase/amino-acid N-acetyltransferase
MGTMLCFITTDAAISADMIKAALLETVKVTFNRISVDGDTSTNDMCVIMANGLAGNDEITEQNGDYRAFADALTDLCRTLARRMAADGEGAKHVITCTVSGADSVEKAETLSKSVISSTLTKAAIFGSDANWGRVLCAMGYSGAEFDPETVDVSFKSPAGEIEVCRLGRGLAFDEDLAKKILTEPEIEILITLREGGCECTCWGCDITYDYIRINGDYRT